MPNDWNNRIHEACDRIEDEARRLVDYLNDEVVLEVRRGSSDMLRRASEELQKLAQRLDQQGQQDQQRRPPQS